MRKLLLLVLLASGAQADVILKTDGGTVTLGPVTSIACGDNMSCVRSGTTGVISATSSGGGSYWYDAGTPGYISAAETISYKFQGASIYDENPATMAAALKLSSNNSSYFAAPGIQFYSSTNAFMGDLTGSDAFNGTQLRSGLNLRVQCGGGGDCGINFSSRGDNSFFGSFQGNGLFMRRATTGQDAIWFANTGARLHFGSGLNDWLAGDSFGVVSGGYVKVGSYTDAGLPAAALGAIALNTSQGAPVWGNGTSWQSFGSSSGAGNYWYDGGAGYITAAETPRFSGSGGAFQEGANDVNHGLVLRTTDNSRLFPNVIWQQLDGTTTVGDISYVNGNGTSAAAGVNIRTATNGDKNVSLGSTNANGGPNFILAKFATGSGSNGGLTLYTATATDAILLATTGARLHLGAGSTDYLDSNGTYPRAPNGIVLGTSGKQITASFEGVYAADAGALAAQTCEAQVPLTAPTGCTVDAQCVASKVQASPLGIITDCTVTAADVISFKLCNVTAAAVAKAPGTTYTAMLQSVMSATP